MKQVGHQRSFGPSRDAQDAVLGHSSLLGGAKCQWASDTLCQEEGWDPTARLGSLCPAAAAAAFAQGNT